MRSHLQRSYQICLDISKARITLVSVEVQVMGHILGSVTLGPKIGSPYICWHYNCYCFF